MKRAMVLGCILLSGCTFIDQKVKLDPQFNVDESNVGQGKTVGIKVLDEREDSVIGKRSNAMYQGAKITTEQDIVGLFSDMIQDGLKKKGFEPTAYTDGNPASLKVEIRTLEYDTSTGLWTAGNMGKSAVKVIANNGGKEYEKVYRDEQEIRTVWVASQETNSKVINGAVSGVMTEMFDDEELFAFLAE